MNKLDRIDFGRVKGTEEEFNNFMHKVTEINKIVKNLSSDDKVLNEMGIAEADKYLKKSQFEDTTEEIDEKLLKLTVKDNKTVINKNLRDEESFDQNEMSKEAFMRSVEIDANRRYQERLVRKEKSETLKIQANKAFRRGEYEKALSLYNKAIEHLKDSCVLYTNRALTYISLGLFENALKDCDTALRLNENSLKAWLYKSKCHYELNHYGDHKKCVEEVKSRHPDEIERINEFINSYKKEDIE